MDHFFCVLNGETEKLADFDHLSKNSKKER